MPLAGVICDSDGQKYSFEECIACARNGGPRHCHNPLPMIVAMSQNGKERKDAGISATMLLDGCPRRVILQQEEQFYEKPSAYWARFRGTMAHAMLEQYGMGFEDVIQEVRFRKSIDVDGAPAEITGKMDWVDVQRKLIIDFKSTKSITTQPINKGKAKDGHEEQVNIYRWLLWGGLNMDTKEIQHIEITKGGILYLDMKGTVKVHVRIWEMDETEEFIRNRLRPIVQYKADGVLPPIWQNDKGGRHHFCNWCAVKEICDAREAELSE